MTPELAAYVTAFVTLFVVVDPVGLAPMFVALTQGADAAHRRTVGIRACLIGAVLLTLFGLFGETLLAAIGISLPAFRIAGGILLFLTALDMLFERRTKRRREQSEPALDPADDPSVFPLATPLLAGPGAMAAMILLAGEGDGWSGFFTAFGVMLAVLAVALSFFFAAGLLEKLLKETGINVLTRLLGMLLAALAVQFVLDGIAQTGLTG